MLLSKRKTLRSMAHNNEVLLKTPMSTVGLASISKQNSIIVYARLVLKWTTKCKTISYTCQKNIVFFTDFM